MISRSPLKECHSVGCGELIPVGQTYCDKHKGETERYYNEHVRNHKAQSFYSSREWRKVRAYVMARDDYLCQLSLRDKRIVKADLVHHIFPLENYPELALSPSNLIALSHEQHNLLHSNDGMLTDKGKELMEETRRKMK
jgi:5-methylcytosine-specific restriction endonuclease McrA